MAILENIRKRTTVLILIIGMALFAFVISGIFTSNDFSGGVKIGSSVATVNGEDISIDEFRNKLHLARDLDGAEQIERLGNGIAALESVITAMQQAASNSVESPAPVDVPNDSPVGLTVPPVPVPPAVEEYEPSELGPISPTR